MKIAIFGSGGVGGYFGGRLAQAGEDVTFIARGRHLAAMQENGLTIESIEGDVHLDSVQATDDPAEVGVVDAVIVATKTWQVPDAAEAMKPMVGSETLVVPLLNGIEATKQLRAVLGEERVIYGFCGLVSYIDAPGKIAHRGISPFVQFGEGDNERTPRVERLLAAFEQTRGVAAQLPEDIQAAVWHKFLLIAPWSSIGSLTRATVEVWRSTSESRALWQQLMAETVALAQAQNINLTQENIDKVTAMVDGLPNGMTASMQRDVMDSRPSELEAQCGVLVRLGEQLGVDVPANRFAYASLLPQEMAAREV